MESSNNPKQRNTLLYHHSKFANKISELFSPLSQTTQQKHGGSPNNLKTLRKMRIRAQDDEYHRKCYSFELKTVDNIKRQQRRKSGVDQLSEKLMRLNCLYPKTSVQQLEIVQNELLRTKERKKTLFKRMSSILIKHQTILKKQGDDQRNADVQLLLLQEQMENNQTPLTSSIKKTKFRSSVIEGSKVVLNISRKTKKAFVSIQSYVNEKAEKGKDLMINSSVIQKPTNPFLNYASHQSLTEMNGYLYNSSPQTQRKQPKNTLPELKLLSSARNSNVNESIKAKLLNNIYNTSRKSRVTTKV